MYSSFWIDLNIDLTRSQGTNWLRFFLVTRGDLSTWLNDSKIWMEKRMDDADPCLVWNLSSTECKRDRMVMVRICITSFLPYVAKEKTAALMSPQSSLPLSYHGQSRKSQEKWVGEERKVLSWADKGSLDEWGKRNRDCEKSLCGLWTGFAFMLYERCEQRLGLLPWLAPLIQCDWNQWMVNLKVKSYKRYINTFKRRQICPFTE